MSGANERTLSTRSGGSRAAHPNRGSRPEADFLAVAQLAKNGRERTGSFEVSQITGCEFQAPQKCLRLICVYAINFMP
jgi:hypothetical protein